MIAYLQSNIIELLALVMGLVYLWLSVNEKILLWLFGLITSVLYIYVCYTSKLYADMGINAYYVVVSVYGWFNWKYFSTNNSAEKPITRITAHGAILGIISIVVIFLIIAYILVHFTDSDIPYWDAFTTAGSIVATWMLARKILEHWIIWVVVDAVSIGLYIYKSLYFTTVLFVVYTVMAVYGFITWKKHWMKLHEKA